MKIFIKIILAILVFLALSSGVTKILLMPQDTEFFGPYGFTDPMLIAFGIAQVIGGILLIIPKTRIAGALLVGITFLISLILLLMAGNIAFALITLVFVVLLGLIIKQSLSAKASTQ